MLEQVKEILVDELGVEEDEVTPQANLMDDLGADSLDMAQVVMALEDEFEIKVANEDLPAIKTVADIVKYIESHK